MRHSNPPSQRRVTEGLLKSRNYRPCLVMRGLLLGCQQRVSEGPWLLPLLSLLPPFPMWVTIGELSEHALN